MGTARHFSHHVFWSELECEIVRSLYPKGTHKELLTALSGRSLSQIQNKANQMGVVRFKNPKMTREQTLKAKRESMSRRYKRDIGAARERSRAYHQQTRHIKLPKQRAAGTMMEAAMLPFDAWIVVDADGNPVHRYSSSGIYMRKRSAETLAYNKNYPSANGPFRVQPVTVTPKESKCTAGAHSVPRPGFTGSATSRTASNPAPPSSPRRQSHDADTGGNRSDE